MNYIIELAEIKDLDSILELYLERIKWFKDNGIKQWSSYLQNHPKEEFIESINNNEFYIIKQENEIVACFELSLKNSNWDDNITPAYYINKVVTKVGYRNLGKIIIDNAREIAKKNNKHFLRLDCLRYNEKLNNIYEGHGLKLVRYGKNTRYSYSLREMKIDD